MSHLSRPYLIDTHAHLNFAEFADQESEILVRAKEQGVLKIVCVGTGLETNDQVFNLASRHENIWATVGYHPIHVEDYKELPVESVMTQLEAQLGRQKVVAIGEIGLDYFRRDDREDQKKIFRMMLELAIKHNLPVIIHCREAFSDMFEILEDFGGKVRGVLHCFTGGVEEARRALDLGLMIGLTGLITYKNNDHILEAIEEMPIDRILTETDCPYLSPVPLRGQINEPANVRYVAEKIGEIKNLTYDEVLEWTSRNAEGLFAI